MIIKVIASFFISMCFGGAFQLRLKGMLLSGLAGGISWLTFDVAKLLTGSEFFSFFLASCSLNIYAEVTARRAKMPAICFIVPGLVPLVPGAALYGTMYEFVLGRPQEAWNSAIFAFSTAVSISLGFILTLGIARMKRPIRIPFKK
ncbi:threonine/serine exporter family protein [Paenibacillus taiwanensis]|uniref:threonine/serine exporter family protein n=1 Tax=Paenibacillus taiwanensis TaxID=401638 RepID=UPI00041FA67B|nr:threonine/serine exporter family protein [Paenibacillus taiwanensis]